MPMAEDAETVAPAMSVCPACGAALVDGRCAACDAARRRSSRVPWRAVLIVAVVALLLNGLALVTQYARIDRPDNIRSGTSVEQALQLLTLLPALGLGAVGFVMSLFRGSRRGGLGLLVCSAIWFITAAVAMGAVPDVRHRAIEQLIDRSAPLVAAIKDYESRHGAPPAELADLVPEHLSSIPSAVPGQNIEYEYYVGAKAEVYAGNPWVLAVSIPRFMGVDLLMYFPKQNYPERGYRGPTLRRIKDWALDID
jgi:hypothetical protein